MVLITRTAIVVLRMTAATHARHAANQHQAATHAALQRQAATHVLLAALQFQAVAVVTHAAAAQVVAQADAASPLQPSPLRLQQLQRLKKLRLLQHQPLHQLLLRDRLINNDRAGQQHRLS